VAKSIAKLCENDIEESENEAIEENRGGNEMKAGQQP
jgi:hypothetical protein